MPDHLFCIRCGATYGGKVKTSLIGRRRFVCSCGQANKFPPGSMGRIIYGCIWGLMSPVILTPFLDLPVVIPGPLWFVFLFMSALAWDNIGKIRRARAFHQEHGSFGSEVDYGPDERSSEVRGPAVSLLAKMAGSIVGGIMGLLGLSMALSALWLIGVLFMFIATPDKVIVLKGEYLSYTRWAIIILVIGGLLLFKLNDDGKRSRGR